MPKKVWAFFTYLHKTVDLHRTKGLNSIRTRVSSFNGLIDIITQPNMGHRDHK